MNSPPESITAQQILVSYLQQIEHKRSGGAINFRGTEFQIAYAVLILLDQLNADSGDKYVHLEGLEDIDVVSERKPDAREAEYIQLKSSQNPLNAGTFWTLGVLQNFLEVYALEPTANFRLVYNMKISDGNLHALISGKITSGPFAFWAEKLNSLGERYRHINFAKFLSRISYEKHNLNDIISKIRLSLLKNWNVNVGTEDQYFKALFYFAFTRSKERSKIFRTDIQELLITITDSFSKAPVNLAWRHNWLAPVIYQTTGKANDDYFEGKAAKPVHIADQLPVRRKGWEQQINTKLNETDAVVIRSSSGQGKSTLAWQVGFNLSKQYKIYQLYQCVNWEQVNAIKEFLTARIIIGEQPLIVIDGLDSTLSYWSVLAEKIANLPVKLLITSRYEDWYRYGADISRIGLQIIDIQLSQSEAKEIYQQLKQKNKLYTGSPNWQPVWEQVQDRGLLIEYTYLLTRGQMIEDRIKQQLKELTRQGSAAAKLEILRIVAVADCLNLKVETKILISYINKTILFEQDRGAVFQELESEYFIRFDQQYVEGLHPVRSEHIKDALHDFVSIADTLIVVYTLLGEDKYDFFANAPGMLKDSEKPVFYKQLAGLLVNGAFTDMAAAFDGILHGEPQMYWLKNKSFFDQAHCGGGIEIFVYDSIPFANLKTLQKFGEMLGDDGGQNFRKLAEIAEKLPEYTLKDTGVSQFGSALSLALPSRTAPIVSYEGLEFLYKWFNKLELTFNLKIETTREHLIRQLVDLPVTESKDLFVYCRIENPEKYRDFINKNKSEIISLLKVKTDSIMIREEGDEITINYLLRDDEINQANDLSVDRIRTISSFLPYYEKYNTQAILLPFPNEQLVSTVRMNSNKGMTLESIGSLFDVNLNVIWSSTILKNYAASSVFDWQKGILDIRAEAVETVKPFVRFLDSLIERNRKKQLATIEPMIKQREKLSALLTVRKPFPSYKTKVFDIKTYEADQKIIDSWLVHLSNLNSQFQNIVNPLKDNDRNIGIINLKATYFDLEKMQAAFNTIEKLTFQYFDNSELLSNEANWYNRLYQTVMYFLHHEPIESQQPKAVGKNAVFEWWDSFHDRKLNKVKKILNEIASSTDLVFHLPTQLKETDTLTFATFGVANLDHTNGYELLRFSLLLKPLKILDIHFYSVFFVDNDTVRSGLRFSKDYIEEVSMEPGLDIVMPIPILPDEESLLFLPELKFTKTSLNDVKAVYTTIIYDLWRLTESRAKLDQHSAVELSWLVDLEDKYSTLILDRVRMIPEDETDMAFLQWSLDIVEGKEMHSKEEFVEKLFEVISL